MHRASSSNRRSKQTHSPMVPKAVSKVVMAFPGERVSDSRNRCPPWTCDIKQVGLPVLGQLAAVGAVDVAGVVDPGPSDSSGTVPPTSRAPAPLQVDRAVWGLAASGFAVGAEALLS